MIPNWTWRLNSQKYFIYTNYLLLRSKFCSVSLYDLPFPRYNMYKVGENRKCTEWPQTEFEDLTVKNTLYALNTYPEAQILVNFALWLAISEIQHVHGRRKSQMHQMTPIWTWKLNRQKYSICTKYLITSEAQILVRFAIRLAVSKIQHLQSQWKLEIHRMTPNWTWRLNSQKYSIYTKCLPHEAQILDCFTLRLAISEIQHVQDWRKSEMHRMTPNWTWRINSKKYFIYTKYLPPRPKYWSVSLYD